MQHPYFRQGMAEERIARLIADARPAQQTRGWRRLSGLLGTIGERLHGEHPPSCAEVGTARASEAI